MSKIIRIFVSIVFLISFIGVHISKHYSHGKLYSIAFFGEAKSCCSSDKCCATHSKTSNQIEGMGNEHSACRNETEIIKIDDVFNVESYSFPKTSSLIAFLLLPADVAESIIYSKNIKQHLSFSSPPGYLKNFQATYSCFIC